MAMRKAIVSSSSEGIRGQLLNVVAVVVPAFGCAVAVEPAMVTLFEESARRTTIRNAPFLFHCSETIELPGRRMSLALTGTPQPEVTLTTAWPRVFST